MKPEACSCWS